MEPKKLVFIDTLRGLAALYVVVYHLTMITRPVAVPPTWLINITNAGGSGVMLFFIVSAFTLCLSMESRSTGAAEPVANFYIRRLFRIAPLFYLWLVIYYVRDIWYYRVYHSAGMVAQSVFFVFNLTPGQEAGYVWASWTIGVEMLFYAMFPLIFARARNIGIAFAVFLIAMAIRVPWHYLTGLAITDPTEAEAYYDYSIIYNLGVFSFGIVVYQIYKLIDHAAAIRHGAGYALTTCFFVGLVWDCYCSPGWDRSTQVLVQTLLYSALLLGLCISPVKPVVNRITQFFGKISYSVYLSHATTVFFMSPIFAYFYSLTRYKTLAFGASFATAMLVITPISYLTYRLVEQPGNALGRTLIRRLARRRPALETV
jgi:peptidoglycan/LPS O-acetylase OafA/YrhL